MSSRITYANGAAVLVDFIRECEGVSELKGDAAAIDFIAAWIAGGKSMPELCRAYGLTWGVLAAWIRRDPERNERYSQAMVDRSAFRKERLLDGWWEVADAKVEEAPGHGDVHKARESLAKAEGMFKDQQQMAVGVTVRFDSVDARA
jgi:hypothetical protein